MGRIPLSVMRFLRVLLPLLLLLARVVLRRMHSPARFVSGLFCWLLALLASVCSVSFFFLSLLLSSSSAR